MRTAMRSSAANGSSDVTAMTFSPIGVRYTALPMPSSLCSAATRSAGVSVWTGAAPVVETATRPAELTSISSNLSFSENCSSMRRRRTPRPSSVCVSPTESCVMMVDTRDSSARRTES